MIYSEDINRVCGLCAHAVPTDDEEFTYCEKKRKNRPVTNSACRKFQYDILKRAARRKPKKLKTYSPADFELI